jgi:CRISPR-associated protein Csh2
MSLQVKRSDLIYIYDSKFCVPNGDPFTGEQRYDESVGKVLISDVRIKRYIRDHILDMIKAGSIKDTYIYVRDIFDSELETIKESKIKTSSSAQIALLKKIFENDPSVFTTKVGKKGVETKECQTKSILLKCIDVILFGGLATEEGDSNCITGPVQFQNMNPSLNQVELLTRQNTSVFKSDIAKAQGAIGTDSIVPYSINQIVGWVNPVSAIDTRLTEEHVLFMLKSLWDGVNMKNTRSKAGQSSLLSLKINHVNPLNKLNDPECLITLNKPCGTNIRSAYDFTFDFSRLANACTDSDIESIEYRCTHPIVKTAFLTQMASVTNKLISF